jgi:hypothetical protein
MERGLGSRLDDIEAEVDGVLNAADGYVVGYSPVEWVEAADITGGCHPVLSPEYWADHTRFWVPGDDDNRHVVMPIDSGPWIGGVLNEGRLRPSEMTVCREVSPSGPGNDVEVTEIELFGLDTVGDGETEIALTVIPPPTKDGCFLITVADHDRYPAYSLRVLVAASSAGGGALDIVDLKEVTVGYTAD